MTNKQVVSEKSRVVKATGTIGAATLLSRILGFLRDAVMAWYFGAGFSSDAFIAAFRIPNLLRRLFAEGTISSTFIPVFTDYLINCGRREALALAKSTLRVFSIILVVISLTGVFLSPLIVHIIAPGFEAQKLVLTTLLTRIMFPYIFFIGLVGLCMGILNVMGHFAAPALAPVLLNLAMIGAIFFLSPLFSTPVVGLALGVLIGGFFQLLLQIPFLMNKGVFLWEKANLYHPGLKQIGRLIPPVIVGGAVYQINLLVSTFLASLLKEGSISYLYFADRLVQFPLGIFAIAASTAILPSLSRQAAFKNYESLRDTFNYAVRMVLFITVPAMIGLILLREPIVTLLFQRGAFDAEATRLTADALLYYGSGLWAFAAVRIVVAVFFALQDTRTPVQMAIISIIANIILGMLLLKPLAHGGLALAVSLSSALNLCLLVLALRTRLGRLGWRSIMWSAVRTLAMALMMGAAVWVMALFFLPANGKETAGLFTGVMLCIIAGILVYCISAILFRSPEFSSVVSEIRKGIKKK